jgi:hypothetical protein
LCELDKFGCEVRGLFSKGLPRSIRFDCVALSAKRTAGAKSVIAYRSNGAGAAPRGRS